MKLPKTDKHRAGSKSFLAAVFSVLCMAAFTVHAADKTLTSPGATSEESPYDLYAGLNPKTTDNLIFNFTGLAYFTNTASAQLCNAITWTKGDGVILGSVRTGASLSGNNGFIEKRGDWNVGYSFMLGQTAGAAFAFTNAAGNISTTDLAASTRNSDKACNGRLQLGLGNNATVEYCQNAGSVRFQQLLAGYSNVSTAGANSLSRIVLNGGTFEIAGKANLGASAKENTVEFENNGATVVFGDALRIGYGTNSIVRWNHTAGETSVTNGSVWMGWFAGDKVRAYHSGGAFTVKNHIYVGTTLLSGVEANETCFEISGGAVTNSGTYSVTIGYGGVAGTKSELKVTGNGRLYANTILNIGCAGSATLTIDGDGLVEVPNKAVYMSNSPSSQNYTEAGEDCRLNLMGGMLVAKGVKRQTTSGTTPGKADCIVTFDGGTLKATDSPETPFIPKDTLLSVMVGDGGGTIDTSLASVTIASDISGVDGATGGMAFKGGNAATVTGTLSYAGATSVEMGTTLTVASRADVFDTGAGLVCTAPAGVSHPAARTIYSVLKTSGADAFTKTDLAKCSFSGVKGAVFALSDGGKTIICKRRSGLMIYVR